MNDLVSRLGDMGFSRPPVKQETPRSDALFSELKFRLVMFEKEKKPGQVLQLVATFGGIQRIVKSIGHLDGDVLILETYEGKEYAVTYAPMELVAITLKLVEGGEEKRFTGLNTSTRPASPC